MDIFLQCISCRTKSRSDETSTSASLIPQPYLTSQPLDRNFRRRRFRSASSIDWQPSLTAITEETSDGSSHGDRKHRDSNQQQKRLVVASDKIQRSSSVGKTRGRSESVGCSCCGSFASIFASSSAAPFMF